MNGFALGSVISVAAAIVIPPVCSRGRPHWEVLSGDARWCWRRSDGVHPDVLALPPCSGYFQCWRGQLLRLDACPRGLCFSARRQICLEPEYCDCEMLTVAQPVHGGKPGPPAEGVSLEQGYWGVISWAGRRHLHMTRMSKRVAHPSQTDTSRWHWQQGLVSAEAGFRMDYYNVTKWPQVNALLAFQARVFSLRKNVLRNWKVPSNSADSSFVCKWAGVTCTNGNIVSLSLPNQDNNPLWAVLTPPPNSTSGDTWRVQSIPPEFGDLTALTELDLSNNGVLETEDLNEFQRMRGLEGPIPSEIGRITNLQKLNLAGNSFSGPIPDTLGLLTQLTELQLGKNKLQGDIPESLCNLANLTLLDISYNVINGSIPWCISGLRSLGTLSLLWLPVTGTIPESLGEMLQLSVLSLQHLPNLGGSIPDSLSKLTGLQTLDVQDTNLTGSLPLGPWWQGLMNLTSVRVLESPITGQLPRAMGPAIVGVHFGSLLLTQGLPGSLVQDLCNVSKPGRGVVLFYIVDTPLGGRLPSVLSSCVSLQYLFLTNCGFEGELPPSFLDTVGQKLVKFDVSGNRLTGQLGASLMLDMTEATLFNVGQNQFSGQAPTLRCAEDLTEFNIGQNKFEGDVGRVLSGAKGECTYQSLTIDLSSNNLTGKLPSNWLRGGMSFSIANNSITGTIPPIRPKNCAVLSYLDLSNNHLQGSIPASLINKCTNLAQLRLSKNSLSGPVPSAQAPGSGNSMQVIELSENRLSDSIPSSLSKLAGLRTLNLSANNLSGPVLQEIGNWVLLSALDLSSNHLTQSIPETLGSLVALTSLSLANNSLSGPIPLQLAPPFLGSLLLLDLSSNELSGPIPYGFSLPKVYGMSLNLSYNNLSGQVPGNSSGPLGASPNAVSGNPSLCGGAGYPECPVEVQEPQGLTVGQVVGIVVGLSAFFVIVGVVVGWRLDRNRSEWDRGALLTFKEFNPPLTTRSLVRATDNFSDEYLLGKGGFGSVYKAELPDGSIAAIKRLTIGSAQGEEEFKSEVQVLGSLSHKNIVKLLAAYVASAPSRERLLVYEYLSGGSLDQIIVPEMDESSPFCSFPVRRQMALDVARGLKYLHHDCSPGIIHRDMKPANIIVGSDFVARVADFGLATSLDQSLSHQTVDGICGTAGYVAPEYHTLHRVSFKSDVYAYGVTLIQIMTGRRSTDEEIVEKGLSRWASSGSSIIDPNMCVADKEVKLVLGCLKIGVLCTAKLPCDRPSIQDVVELLQKLESFVESLEI